MDKFDALQLSDWLEDQYDPTHNLESAAAELRRLHVQRDALLEALKNLLSYANQLEIVYDTDADGEHRTMQQARATIKAVEENT